MPIKLNGTDGISTTSGTATNPSIKSISYGNTSGLYFPSSNTVGIATSGVDAIRVTETQKVGIGTNSPAYTLDVAGDLRVTGDVLGSSQFTLRNRLINGDMRLNQRAASYTLSPTVLNYTLDRWCSAIGPNALGATVTVTRQNSNNRYFMRFNHSAGTLSSGYGYVTQVIESTNCFELAGRNVTLSFKLRKGSSFVGTVLPQITTGSGIDEGSGKAVTSTWTNYQYIPGTEITNSQISSSDFTTFSRTFTIPSNANEVAVFLIMTGMSAAGGATNYLDITDVQLELGSNATPFERLPFWMQVQGCQRYYSKCSDLDVYPVNGASYWNTYGMYISGVLNAYAPGTGYCSTINFPTTMRIKPNITFFRTGLSTQTPPPTPTTGIGGGVSTAKDGQWDVYDNAIGWGSSYLTWIQGITQTQFSPGMQSALYITGSAGTYINWTAGSKLFYGAWTADAEL